jgi:hypothetical protein
MGIGSGTLENMTIPHDMIMNGGELVFEMSDKPG